MVKVVGNRVLRQQIPSVRVEGTSETNTFGIASADYGDGWEIVNNGTAVVMLVWRGYFDLTGINSEDLSTFVDGVAFQEANTHRAENLLPGGLIHTWDIVTKRELTSDSFDSSARFSTVDNFWNPPGTTLSIMDLEEVLYGRYRTFAPDTNVANNVVQIATQRWGREMRQQGGSCTSPGFILFKTSIQQLEIWLFPLPPSSFL